MIMPCFPCALPHITRYRVTYVCDVHQRTLVEQGLGHKDVYMANEDVRELLYHTPRTSRSQAFHPPWIHFPEGTRSRGAPQVEDRVSAHIAGICPLSRIGQCSGIRVQIKTWCICSREGPRPPRRSRLLQNKYWLFVRRQLDS
jgi:hypothetical protein